jgi:hypothetical protein
MGVGSLSDTFFKTKGRITSLNVPNILQDLGNGLTIKSRSTEHDIDLVAGLNAEIRGKNEAKSILHWLKNGHPQIVPEGWLFVQDERTGQAVATLCLLPMTWRYGPVALPATELGFVSTRAAYRKRGLQRALTGAFDYIALVNSYTLAAIEGIPYCYRQFRYEFVIPMEDGIANSRYTFSLEEIPPIDILFPITLAHIYLGY